MIEKTLNFTKELRTPEECRGFIIAPDTMGFYWPLISAELDKVPEIWNVHWTKEALYQSVMTGRFQVWGFGPNNMLNVIVFTEIAAYPANRILRIFLAFGNSLEIALPVIAATLERFAQISDCPICEVIGRIGWERKLPQCKKIGSILRYEVGKQRVH